MGNRRKRTTKTISAIDFMPTLVVKVELSQPLPALSADGPGGSIYTKGRIAVFLHHQPLGMVDVHFDTRTLAPEEYAPIIWNTLGPMINQHLSRDGLAVISDIPAAGIQSQDLPACLHKHNLEQAPFVSVVVCTRDRTDDLRRCLHALLALDYPSYEVIVVDNAPSTDDTLKLITSEFSDASQVRYIREPVPGLAIAHACGIRQVQGLIVAFTDDDAIVEPYWLTEIVHGFEDPQVACVTGLALPLELETQAQEWFEQFGGFNRNDAFIERRHHISDLPQVRRHSPLYPYTAAVFGAGVNMSFRTSVLRDIGGFDLALGPGRPAAGGEEIDAFFRLVSRGHALLYQPRAVVWHTHRRDYAGLQKQLMNYGIGFTAFITHCLIDNPYRIIDLLGKLPYIAFYLLSPKSPKHAKKQGAFPQELVWLEVRGMMYGPFAYIKSRWQLRHNATLGAVNEQFASLGREQ